MLSREIKTQAPALLDEPLPKHVAIIMDGNRRWARERGLPAIEGHRRGIASLREAVRTCSELGIPTLTVYGFSEENWKRGWLEVSALFELCCAFARLELAGLQCENVRVRVIGRWEELPPRPRRALADLIAGTAACTGTTLNLAVNYSARMELRDAARRLAKDVRLGTLSVEAIGDETLDSYLYTAGTPDPDLLIRPGGEFRLSNFLLYQMAYTELFVTDVCWPEFSREHFFLALAAYQQRQRRFGT